MVGELHETAAGRNHLRNHCRTVGAQVLAEPTEEQLAEPGGRREPGESVVGKVGEPSWEESQLEMAIANQLDVALGKHSGG